jgi:hypothetical protein
MCFMVDMTLAWTGRPRLRLHHYETLHSVPVQIQVDNKGKPTDKNIKRQAVHKPCIFCFKHAHQVRNLYGHFRVLSKSQALIVALLQAWLLEI